MNERTEAIIGLSMVLLVVIAVVGGVGAAIRYIEIKEAEAKQRGLDAYCQSQGYNNSSDSLWRGDMSIYYIECDAEYRFAAKRLPSCFSKQEKWEELERENCTTKEWEFE